MLLTPPTAVLFDWDNTLVESWDCLHSALNATLQHYEKEQLTKEEVQRRSHYSLRDSFPKVFGPHWEEAAKLFYQHYKELHLVHLYPLPQAEQVLSRLQEMDIYTGIVSNKNSAILRQEIEKLNWQPYFNKVVGSTDAAHDKPSTDVMHLALSDLPEYEPQNVWLIGDTVVDIDCARNFGCVAILFGQATMEHELPLRKAADHHFVDHASLFALLDNMK